MKRYILLVLREFCRAGLAAVLAYFGITTTGCLATGSSSTACLINTMEGK